MRTILAPALLAGLLALLTAAPVHAYGCCSRSGFAYNPNTGRTASYSPSASRGGGYGAYGHSSFSASGPNGSYSGSRSGSYSPSMYGGYSAAGHTGYGSASVSRSYSGYYP